MKWIIVLFFTLHGPVPEEFFVQGPSPGMPATFNNERDCRRAIVEWHLPDTPPPYCVTASEM